jgi:hypothetical protein
MYGGAVALLTMKQGDDRCPRLCWRRDSRRLGWPPQRHIGAASRDGVAAGQVGQAVVSPAAPLCAIARASSPLLPPLG